MALRSFLFASFVAAVAIVATSGPVSARAPTNEEQLMVEMVNRMRADPQAELNRLVNINTVPSISFGTPSSPDSSTSNAISFFQVNAATLMNQWQQLSPAPPVAWNEQLAVSSLTYSNVMLSTDSQAHNLDSHKFQDGSVDLIGRIEASGYTFNGVVGNEDYAGESIFAFADNVFHGHAAFAIDWGQNPPSGIQNPAGHRDLIMDARMREIGIGIVVDTNFGNSVGPRLITQHYAVDDDDGPFLTGVIYREADNNNFYSVGEGLGGITVIATDVASGQKFTTTTYGSGGYNLDLVSGRSYDIVASGPGFGQYSASGVFIGQDNVKHDFVTTSTPLLGDANMDGIVNRLDVAAVSSNFGLSTGALWGNGDFNFDGKVTIADLMIVQRNLSPAGSPMAVPEPSALVLVALSLACVGLIQVRQRL